eukprot:scaffold1714_cov111-Isochrysis_galbana.AAC.2
MASSSGMSASAALTASCSPFSPLPRMPEMGSTASGGASWLAASWLAASAPSALPGETPAVAASRAASASRLVSLRVSAPRSSCPAPWLARNTSSLFRATMCGRSR